MTDLSDLLIEPLRQLRARDATLTPGQVAATLGRLGRPLTLHDFSDRPVNIAIREVLSRE